MKKFYTLLVAVLVAATASAQVTVQSVGSKMNRTIPFKAVEKKTTPMNLRAAGETWIYYPNWDAAYWGADSVKDGMAVYLKSDSTGLYPYSTSYDHPWVHSISQTYDFTSTFFDEVIGEGQMSFYATQKLNLDSIIINGMYLRDDDYTAVDTLMIGIKTIDTADLHIYQFTSYQNACFVDINADHSTGLQEGVTKIIKFPLTAEHVSQPVPDHEGYYYYARFEIPVDMLNIQEKVWNVAYSFKTGQNPALNDTLKSHLTAYFACSADPNYFITHDQPMRCSNLSHGQIVCTFSNSGLSDYYYPGFALGGEESQADFSENIQIKVSCSDCAIVNVPEIEKNKVTVYPNPATEKFTVNLGNDESANVQLFNLVGQQVYSGVINGQGDINTANLNSGVYMLKINQNGKVYTSKVIVK